MSVAVSGKEMTKGLSPTTTRRSGLARWRWPVLGVGLVVALAAAARVQTRQYLIEFGPFSLAARHGAVAPLPRALTLPVDGWVRGLSYELVDEDGEQLPSGALHHLNLIAIPEPHPFHYDCFFIECHWLTILISNNYTRVIASYS